MSDKVSYIEDSLLKSEAKAMKLIKSSFFQYHLLRKSSEFLYDSKFEKGKILELSPFTTQLEKTYMFGQGGVYFQDVLCYLCSKEWKKGRNYDLSH